MLGRSIARVGTDRDKAKAKAESKSKVKGKGPECPLHTGRLVDVAEYLGEESDMQPTLIHRVEADGVSVFYREAGLPEAPVVLLLHGFPTYLFSIVS